MGFAKYNNRGVIHLYQWTAENTRVADTRMEIDAHENGVNDLALTNLDGSLVAVSGGGDCKVKVWSATSGTLMFCFTGVPANQAEVHSCSEFPADSYRYRLVGVQDTRGRFSQCALTSRAIYRSCSQPGVMVASKLGFMIVKWPRLWTTVRQVCPAGVNA